MLLRRELSELILGLLFAALMVSRTLQQTIPGFSNVQFTTQPQDKYVLPTAASTTFGCTAQGISNTTHSLTPVPLIIYINEQAIDRFGMMGQKYFITTNGGTANIPTGVRVVHIGIDDNGLRIHCQVANCPIDGSDCSGLGINSTTGVLTVADGRPPAILLTQSNTTIRSVKVRWNDVLVPQSGPLTSYNITIHSMENQLISHELVTEPINVTEYMFKGLEPHTSYYAAVVAVNKYGVGNTTIHPQVISTAAPLVPDQPVDVKAQQYPAIQIIVTWKAPMVNPLTQTPITGYVLTYMPVGVPENTTTVNVSTLQYMVSDVLDGTNYSISVAAVNSAGVGPAILTNVVTAPTNVTPSLPAALPQTTSYPQAMPTIMPTLVLSSSSSSSSIAISSLNFIITASTITAATTTITNIMSTSIVDSPPSALVLHQSSSSSVLSASSLTMEPPSQPPTQGAANVVIIASGAVAFTLIVVITIIACVLIVVCVKNMRQDSDHVDLPEFSKASPWIGPDKRLSVLKDGSSMSSDSNELPHLGQTPGAYRSVLQNSPTGREQDLEIQVEGSPV